MTSTQELLFNVTGQKFVLDAPFPLNSVSAVYVRELGSDDASTDLSATTGSAVARTAFGTSTAAVGRGQTYPERIPVASTANFVVGRRYALIAGDASLWEVFELLDLATNLLTARHPFRNAYTTGASVVDLRATIAVSATWIAEVGNVSSNANANARYQVAWHVTRADVDSTPDVLYTNVDVVRRRSDGFVNPLDVEVASPGWIDALGPDDQSTQGRSVIAEAVRLVKMDLYREGFADQALRNAEVHAAGVIARTLLLTVEANVRRGAATIDALKLADDGYTAWLDGLVRTPVLAVDETGGGGASSITERSQPIWGRMP